MTCLESTKFDTEGETFCTIVINEKYYDGEMKTQLSGEENCTLSTPKTT